MASSFTAKTTFEDILTYKKCEIQSFLRQHNVKISGSKDIVARRAFEYVQLNLGVVQSTSIAESDGDEKDSRSTTNDTESSISNVDELKFGWSSEFRLLPKVTHKDVEKYLLYSSHRTEDNEKMSCYRQFIRGYNFYKEGYVHKIMTNLIDDNSTVCYVRSKCFPSMKKDVIYTQWILITKKDPIRVVKASCSCPAGLGEGCTHLAGLLFAIEANSSTDDNLACTSKPCEWNKPSKRKSTSQTVSNINFKRIKYDDVPDNSRNKRKNDKSVVNKDGFLKNLCNRLGDSNAVLFHLVEFEDNSVTIENEISNEIISNLNVVNWEEVTTSPYVQTPSDRYIDIETTIKTEKHSSASLLEMMDSIPNSVIEEIEFKTRGQSDNPLWGKARSCRLTASSNFHDIKTRKPSTSDIKLVDAIVVPASDDKISHVPALKWGKKHEPIAKKRYKAYKKLKNKHNVTVLEKGIYIHAGKGYLGGSPDGIALIKGEKRLLEIKCPMKWRHKTITDACNSKEFYCYVENGEMKLKKSHKYYTQVQGLMAVCQLQKCDFVIYTLKDIKIIEIDFDKDFWDNLFPKLEKFYINSVIPRLLQLVN